SLSWKSMSVKASPQAHSHAARCQPDVTAIRKGREHLLNHISADVLQTRQTPFRLPVLVDQKRPHTLQKLAMLEQPHGEPILRLERQLQGCKALRMSDSRQRDLHRQRRARCEVGKRLLSE